MASVGNTLPSTDPSTATSNATGAGSSTTSLEDTFLTLLVAQLKNQDPSQPVDGTTFVTQLAEFSNVQQSLAMRQDLDLISNKYDGQNSNNSSVSGTSSTSSSQ